MTSINHHSTTFTLLECIRDRSIGLSNSKQAGAVYTDFAKALDSIALTTVAEVRTVRL
jgi:hypothetical protein